MKVKVFCQTCAGQANMPGMSIKGLQFVGVPTPEPKHGKREPNPNASIFKDGGEGGISLSLNNLSKEVASQFEEGKTYVVEIREAGPAD